jgi:hypothetical protein
MSDEQEMLPQDIGLARLSQRLRLLFSKGSPAGMASMVLGFTASW